MSKTFSQPKTTNRLWQWIKRNIIVIIIPALLLAGNRFFYLLARLISHNIFGSPSEFMNVSFSWDQAIELNSITAVFVIPYIISFVYWIIMPFVVFKVLGKKAFWRLIGLILIVNVIGFFILAFVPTKQDPTSYYQAYTWIFNYQSGQQTIPTELNPARQGFDKLTAGLLSMVYKTDCPDNLAPSFHNTSTFVIFLIFAFPQKVGEAKIKINKKWFIISLIAYLLVMVSTICVRQHCFIDIILALTLCFTALFLTDAFSFENSVEKFFITINSHATNLFRINKLESSKQVIITISFVFVWIVLLSALIYFGAISCLTGDPFKSLWWRGEANWAPWNYMA